MHIFTVSRDDILSAVCGKRENALFLLPSVHPLHSGNEFSYRVYDKF
jgi:hypothetical protein